VDSGQVEQTSQDSGQVYPNRRLNITERIGPFAFTISYHKPVCPCCSARLDFAPMEVFFTMRGTVGHALEDILRRLGIAISRRMQLRED